jgi:hypothetical protein
MSLFSSLTGWTWEQVISGFAAKFSIFMSTRLGKWIVGAMGFLGIDLTVFDTIIAPWLQQAREAWTGLPQETMIWLHFLRLDQVATILLSAYGLRSLKRFFFGRKSS